MVLRHIGWLVGCCGVLAVGCADSNPARDFFKDADNGPDRTVVAASFRGLPNLGLAGHYELFFQTPTGLRSAGTFRVTDGGAVTDLAGEPFSVGALGSVFTPGIEFAGSTEAFITIEPENDQFPTPDGPTVLSGVLSADAAFLDVRGVIARDLSGNPTVGLDSAGAFYLHITPTDDSTDDTNDARGVHFVSDSLKESLRILGIPEPNQPSAELGELPSGFVYEAWVMEDTTGELDVELTASGGANRSDARFLSLGRFSDRLMIGFDSDALGANAGEDLAGRTIPGWVGSDLVRQGDFGEGEDLESGRWSALISVEPTRDNDPARPFAIVLYRKISRNPASGTGTAFSMINAFNVGSALFVPPQGNIRLLP